MRYVALQRLQVFAGRSRRGAGREPADETTREKEVRELQWEHVVIVHAVTACTGGAADVRMADATMTTERSLIHIAIIILIDICGQTATNPESKLTGAGVARYIQQMIVLNLCNIRSKKSKIVTERTFRYFRTDTESAQ